MVPPNNGETKTPIDVSSWIKVIASDKISVSTNSATLLHSTPIVNLNKIHQNESWFMAHN